MNPFDRARLQAQATRAELAGESASNLLTSTALLDCVEDVLEVAIERLPSGHPILGNGSGVLHRNDCTIYIRNDVQDDEAAYLVAHELGHWFLDVDKPEITIAHLSAITAPQGSAGTVAVESYGARERQELQANVFARELLMPREVAKALWDGGLSSRDIAAKLVVPLEVVRLQLIDALLLPNQRPVPPSPLPEWSPSQKAAATAPERFVNVVAGPGTGKTTTLIHRIKHLVSQGVPPSKILVLTFTNKAANELIERLKASGIAGASDVWAGTFHAFGLEFLRKFHHLFGLNADIRVADTLMQVRMMARLLPQISLKYYLRLQDPHDWLPPVFKLIQRLKEELVDVNAYRTRLTQLPPCAPDVELQRQDIASIFEVYEQALKERKLVDYTDLVAFPTLQAIADRASISQYIDYFDHILVDEYQDVTEVMVELVRQLAVNARSVWVVGDVRQAIHHWRGASIMSLVKFDKAFQNAPNGTVRRYALDLNRRSTPEILSLFCRAGTQHALQKQMPLESVAPSRQSNKTRPTLFECRSKASQALTLSRNVTSLVSHGVDYRDQAVISRKTADVEKAAESLAASGVPYLYIGDVYQRPEIKRLVCLMQLLCTRQPRSLVGLSQYPELRMSIADMEILIENSRLGGGLEWQRGKWLGKAIDGISAAGQKVNLFLASLLSGFNRHTNPWEFVCTLLLDRRYGLPASSDQSMSAHTARLAIWLFVYSVRNGDGDASQARLSQFLMREDFRRRIGEKLADRGLPPEARALNAVSLMTVHSSKGLEFKAVHVTDVDNHAYGIDRPYDYDARKALLVPPEVLNSTQKEHDFEETVERNNLLYVALSRARDYLCLYEVDGARRPVPLKAASNFELVVKEGILDAAKTFKLPPIPVAESAPVLDYSQFETYVSCPLQYHYRYELSLTAEQEIDVSMRARWAVMDTLEAILKGQATTQEAFINAWEAHSLPSKTKDPGLHRDAVIAARRGLKIARECGGQLVEGIVAAVPGLYIQLPWMLEIIGKKGVELHWLRAQAGVDFSLKHLRPMLLSLNGGLVPSATVHSLITDKSVYGNASSRPESTAVYSMAQRFIASDRSPHNGWMCGRCAYFTICPNKP